MRQVVWALPLLFASGACSDANGSDDNGAGGSPPAAAGSVGTGGGGGPAGVAGTVGVSGGGGQDPSPTAGTSAGKGAGGSNGGGGGVSPLELEPLALGNLWTYALTVPEPTADCPSGSGTRELTASVEWQGRTAFELHRFCDPEPTYLNVTNGEVYQYLDGWYRNVAAPVQEGATWAFAPGYTLKWSSVGAVTVPAGTFANCWRRSIVEFEGSITFCPGVGQVKIELPTLTAELSAYTLK